MLCWAVQRPPLPLRLQSLKPLSPSSEVPWVCYLTLSILMLPPQSSFNSCSGRWARVIRRVGHHGPRCYSISSCHKLGYSPILPTSRLSSWVMWCSLEGIHSWPVLKSQVTSNLTTTCELLLWPTPHCLWESHSCGKGTGWTKEATFSPSGKKGCSFFHSCRTAEPLSLVKVKGLPSQVS